MPSLGVELLLTAFFTANHSKLLGYIGIMGNKMETTGIIGLL